MVIYHALVCSTIWLLVHGTIEPENPCPKVWSYQKKNGNTYGRIQIDNQPSGIYDLTLETSFATYLEDGNLFIYLETNPMDVVRGFKPVYHVDFPIQHVLPRVTKIELNGQIICSGPGDIMKSPGVSYRAVQAILKVERPQTQQENSYTPSSTPRQQAIPEPSTLRSTNFAIVERDLFI